MGVGCVFVCLFLFDCFCFFCFYCINLHFILPQLFVFQFAVLSVTVFVIMNTFVNRQQQNRFVL